MPDMTFNPQKYYASQGQISDPGEFNIHFLELPNDLSALVAAIQGLMLHMHWAAKQGLSLTRVRKEEANIRTVRARLEKILSLSDRPLSEPRMIGKRTIGTCRDFSLLLASVFRARDIPARARCGFSTYFTKGRFEDHWICEVWEEKAQRWRLVDGQLDPLQIETLKIDFDPLDLPSTKFLAGTQAWTLCRSRRVDPNRFGIFRMKGLDFVKGNFIRDFLALNKIEILPWDNFGLIRKSFIKMNKTELEDLDRLAAVGSGTDQDFVMLRAAFFSHRTKLLPDYFFSD